MANTYTQIYVQVVFAVRERDALIDASWKEVLFRYITGIVTNPGQKLIAIGGVADHIHLLIGLEPDIALSALVRDIKASSSKWINEKIRVAPTELVHHLFRCFYKHAAPLEPIPNLQSSRHCPLALY